MTVPEAATGTTEGAVLSLGEGKTFTIGNSATIIKLSSEKTGGQYEIIESTAPPGFATPPHVHQRMDQSFYVLEGEIDFQLGDRTLTGGPGTFDFVPRGTPHTFGNSGSAWGKLLQIQSGHGLERMFEELAEAFPAGTPLDRQRMGEIMVRYDQRPVQPS
jgi:quercetin dioxygenase-like cupin family protein